MQARRTKVLCESLAKDGIGYRVVSRPEIDAQPSLNNILLTRRFRAQPVPAHTEMIVLRLLEDGLMSVNALKQLANVNEAVLLGMAGRHLIRFDLDQAFDGNTLLQKEASDDL